MSPHPSTIGLRERFAYRNQDPIITLAVASGVTRQVRLMTSVIVLPARNAGVTAKEVASLDVLSGGRFLLGVGIGSRREDFTALDVPWEDRAARLEDRVPTLRRLWNGKGLRAGAEPVEPTPLSPSGARIIYGATSRMALERAARVADGILTLRCARTRRRACPEVQFHKVLRIFAMQDSPGIAGRPLY